MNKDVTMYKLFKIVQMAQIIYLNLVGIAKSVHNIILITRNNQESIENSLKWQQLSWRKEEQQ